MTRWERLVAHFTEKRYDMIDVLVVGGLAASLVSGAEVVVVYVGMVAILALSISVASDRQP